MPEETSLAAAPVTPGFHRATSTLSEFLGIEPRMMVETLKKQCFPGKHPEAVSDATLAAFISVANQMGLNPLIPGMLYAYEGKNGAMVPVCGPDGVLKKLDEEISKDKLDGYECVVYPDDVTQPPTHAVAKIWRKGNERPAIFTAIFKEWYVDQNPNWKTRPRHMMWLRALKQCARQVVHGVPYDEDDVRIGNMINVTPGEDAPVPQVEKRPDPPKREKKGAAAVVENAKREQAIDVETTVGGAGNAQAAAHTEKMKGEAAKIVSEATAANVADIKAAMAAAPVAAPAEGQAAQPAPTPVTKERAALKEGETIEAICTVTDIDCGMMTKHLPTGEKIPTPTVSLRLTGGYYGTAYHFGGATGTDKNNLTPNPLYVPGVKLRFTLLGKVNKIPNSKVPFYTEVLKVAEIEEMGEVG